MTITVYSKPGCVQCMFTKKLLNEKGLEYTELDVTADGTARKMLEDSGKTMLPMVDVFHNGRLIDRWHGFKDDKIKDLTKDS